MNIRNLKIKLRNSNEFAAITYLIFGGQGSVYVHFLEWSPSQKQVKLISKPIKGTHTPVRLRDLYKLPDNTEILIEGYPGDDDHPTEWISPNYIDTSDKGSIDFQFDSTIDLMDKSKKNLHQIKEELQEQLTDKEIKEFFTNFITEAL